MTTSAPPPSENRSIGPPAELAPVIAKYHFFNDLVAGCLSLTINGILIYVLTSRYAVATKSFKRVLLLSKVFELLFSASYIVTAPIMTSIKIEPDFSGLMIVNTGWQFNFVSSQIFLAVAIFLLTQMIFISPWMYYFRYAQVCRKHGTGWLDVVLIVLLNTLLQVLTTANLCYSSIPTAEDISSLKTVADRFTNSSSAFLLLSYTRPMTTHADLVDRITSIIAAVSFVACLMLSVVVMIFCTLKINMKIRESRNISNNLLVLQKKMNRVLLTQFFCPLIFIQLPFYYSVLGPIAGLSQGLPTDLLPLLFAWSPVVNTLLIFLLNSEIRNALIRKQAITATSDARRSFANDQ